MLLRESDIINQPERLAAAWQTGASSFAIKADNSDLSDDWFLASLNTLPAHLKTDHFLMATSGSTGQPKLLVANRQRADQMAKALITAQQLNSTTHIINLLPLSYCFGFINQWLVSQHLNINPTLGAELLKLPELHNQLPAEAQAMICLVGAQASLLEQFGADAQFEKVTTVCFAGSPFPWGKINRLKQLFPNARFYNNYGCAEAMPRLIVRDVTNEIISGTPLPAGFLGQPLDGIKLKTDNDGQLLFQSPYACVGSVTPDGYTPFDPSAWLETGDHASCDDAGNWSIEGRTSQTFKRMGEKISISRLRATIDTGWDGAYDLYKATDRMGEAGLVLMLEGEVEKSAVKSLLLQLRRNHPRAYWPLRIETTPQLPRLSNGKIDNKALSDLSNITIVWDQRV